MMRAFLQVSAIYCFVASTKHRFKDLLRVVHYSLEFENQFTFLQNQLYFSSDLNLNKHLQYLNCCFAVKPMIEALLMAKSHFYQIQMLQNSSETLSSTIVHQLLVTELRGKPIQTQELNCQWESDFAAFILKSPS